MSNIAQSCRNGLKCETANIVLSSAWKKATLHWRVHWDGDDGDPADSMGRLQGWKWMLLESCGDGNMSWDSRGGCRRNGEDAFSCIAGIAVIPVAIQICQQLLFNPIPM